MRHSSSSNSACLGGAGWSSTFGLARAPFAAGKGLQSGLLLEPSLAGVPRERAALDLRDLLQDGAL